MHGIYYSSQYQTIYEDQSRISLYAFTIGASAFLHGFSQNVLNMTKKKYESFNLSKYFLSFFDLKTLCHESDFLTICNL